jgi:hypothetical protein
VQTFRQKWSSSVAGGGEGAAGGGHPAGVAPLPLRACSQCTTTSPPLHTDPTDANANTNANANPQVAAPHIHTDPTDGKMYCTACWEEFYGAGTAPNTKNSSNIFGAEGVMGAVITGVAVRWSFSILCDRFAVLCDRFAWFCRVVWLVCCIMCDRFAVLCGRFTVLCDRFTVLCDRFALEDAHTGAQTHMML